MGHSSFSSTLRITLLFFFLFILSSCGGGGGGSSNSNVNGGGGGTQSTNYQNSIPVYVGYFNGTLEPNVPFVTIKICVPKTTTCQTFDNILLDTGSTGLRIFSNVLSLSLPNTQYSGQDVGDCQSFGSGTMWGAVEQADVYLAGEPVVTESIQVVIPNYSSNPPPSPCNSSAITTSTQIGFNGILGVGPQTYSGDTYFACNGTSCSQMSVADYNTFVGSDKSGVNNPIWNLNFLGTDSADYNGITLVMNVVPNTGESYTPTSGSPGMVVGTAYLGINSQSDNATTYASGTEYVAYSVGHNYGSGYFPPTNGSGLVNLTYIDSGSNYSIIGTSAEQTFTAPTTCSYSGSTWYCPSSTNSYSYDMLDTASYTYATETLYVGDASTLLAQGDALYTDVYYPGSSAYEVYLGFGFYLGRTIQISTQGSPLSTNSSYAWSGPSLSTGNQAWAIVGPLQ